MTIKNYCIIVVGCITAPALGMDIDIKKILLDSIKLRIEEIEKRQDNLTTELNNVLREAAREGYKSVVTELTTNGIDINEVTHDSSHLHYAARAGNIPMATLLLDAGANINVVNSHGETPLLSAIVEKQFDMVVFLIEHNAKYTYDYYQWTPLKLAKQCCNNEPKNEQSSKILSYLKERFAEADYYEEVDQ